MPATTPVVKATSGQPPLFRHFWFPRPQTRTTSPHHRPSAGAADLAISARRLSDCQLQHSFGRNLEHIHLVPKKSTTAFVFSRSCASFTSRSIGVGMATGSGGGDMGKRKKVELLQEAIHGLLEEKRAKQPQHGEQEEAAMDHQEDLFLYSLLSKLDTLENDADLNGAEPNSFRPDPESSKKAAGTGDIAKDLGKIKKQNMITHILLGTVMVMIAAWQFNEVSFLLAVQKKLTNPFKSLEDTIKSAINKGKQPVVEGLEAPPLPAVGVPDVSRADLPMLAIGNGDS